MDTSPFVIPIAIRRGWGAGGIPPFFKGGVAVSPAGETAKKIGGNDSTTGYLGDTDEIQMRYRGDT